MDKNSETNLTGEIKVGDDDNSIISNHMYNPEETSYVMITKIGERSASAMTSTAIS